jgi:hypothetical protein
MVPAWIFPSSRAFEPIVPRGTFPHPFGPIPKNRHLRPTGHCELSPTAAVTHHPTREFAIGYHRQTSVGAPPSCHSMTFRRCCHSSHHFRVTFRLRSTTVTPLLIAMAKSLEVSPMKSLAEELEFVRKAHRESIQVYSRRVEAQLTALRDTVLEQTKNSNPPPAQLRDLRDMITLCRTLDLKPEKGRRKDLKKIDTLLDELQGMVQNW